MLCATSVSGQVINSVSSDKTNMYIHGLDTVLSLAKKSDEFQRIFIKGEASIISNFPDSLNGLSIVKKDSSVPIDKIKIREGDVVIIIFPVSIIRDEFTVRYVTRNKDGLVGDGQYICCYKYLPETRSYGLSKIKIGFIL
jgi:hypothetical protein